MGILIKKEKEKSRKYLMDKYGMTEKSLKSDVESLKQWLESEPGLPKMKHVDLEKWLENQLLMVRNCLEKAKVSIELYCAARTTYPKLFLRRDITDQNLIQSFDAFYALFVRTVSMLPTPTPMGHCLSIVRIDDPDPEKFNFETQMKRCLMVMEYYLKEGIDFSGLHIIFDLRNLRIGHLTRFNLELMRTMKFAMKAYPTSFSRINIINYPGCIETVLAVFKPFVSRKLLSRIKFLKDVATLYDDLPRRILPSDYGGNLQTQKEWSDSWKSRFADLRDYIKECDNIKCTNYKVSPKSSKTFPESGVHASFRKIEFD